MATFSSRAYDLSKPDETQIAELGIGRKFQKDRVRHAYRRDTLCRRSKTTVACATLPGRLNRSRTINQPLPAGVPARVAAARRTARNSARDGMLLALEPKLARRRTGRRHDRRRNDADRQLPRKSTATRPSSVEHDMAFVRELDVKVTCLHEGSVLAEGTIDQVSANDRVVEVYLGR
jgi:urea transport system ATP-binding protein